MTSPLCVEILGEIYVIMNVLWSVVQQWCTDMEILQSDWIRNFFINSISNPYPKIYNYGLQYPIQIRNRPLSCTLTKIFDNVYFASWGKSCGYLWLAFLFSYNVWPLCCVTITTVLSQFLMLVQHARIIALAEGAVWMQHGAQRGWRNCKSQILIFAKQFLRPHQSGAHGTSHAWHTLYTSLALRWQRHSETTTISILCRKQAANLFFPMFKCN